MLSLPLSLSFHLKQQLAAFCLYTAEPRFRRLKRRAAERAMLENFKQLLGVQQHANTVGVHRKLLQLAADSLKVAASMVPTRQSRRRLASATTRMRRAAVGLTSEEVSGP